MVNVRPPLTDPDPAVPGGRFNVLFAQDRDRAHRTGLDQLRSLLAPFGVHAVVAHSGREALSTADEIDLHAAVIDLALPRDRESGLVAAAATPGGLWLLEVLNRRPAPTPVVVVDTRPVVGRDVERAVAQALRLGAFTVVRRPGSTDAVLAAVRRLIDRRYRGRWPGNALD